MTASNADSDVEAARFTALWETCAGRVLTYARRHADPDLAQEVVSDTFLVAWRRLADVPNDPLPWLLVTARNTLSNHRRAGNRRALLHADLVRLARATEQAPAADVTVTDRAEVLAALATLSVAEREALLLVAWDGLTPAQAAQVADCSASAFYARLFRARQRLHAATTPIDPPRPAHPEARTC